MKNILFQKILIVFSCCLIATSCGKDFLEVDPIGISLESNFYQTEEELFQGLVAVYDVLQWGSTSGWTMILGLTNAASDDCFAGGSDASDQPAWVAWDQFNLTSTLGPQEGLWTKYFAGIYRANLIIDKLENAPDDISFSFKSRSIAEARFLRAWFYFDLVKLFGNVPLITAPIGADEINSINQSPAADIYAQIEADLLAARAEGELPETVPPNEQGRITQSVVAALLGKVILYQNNDSRMLEAASLFEEVINSGLYSLIPNFGDIFKIENEYGTESIFEIVHSDNRPGDWGCCFASGPANNPTEGNFNVQFFGMRDFVGPEFAAGWSFCPVTPDLVDFMQGDPRMQHTIVDGNALRAVGASYTEGFQNTDFFIRKYAPIEANRATDGVIELAWSTNQKEIRLADVLLMAAEALVRGGGDQTQARTYANQVRSRVGVQPFTPAVNGQTLLDAIYRERRMELATEGHRYFDLVRTGQAANVLEGFQQGKHELLPIPQFEIDLTNGRFVQNPGY